MGGNRDVGENKTQAVFTTNRHSIKFAASCGTLILKFSSTRDLCNLKRVNRELKQLTEQEQQLRTGIFFRISPKEVEPDVLQVRLLFHPDAFRPVTLEVTTPLQKRPISLTIRDKTIDFSSDHEKDTFYLNKNILNIHSICIVNEDARHKMEIHFSNKKTALLLNFKPVQMPVEPINALQKELIHAVRANKVTSVMGLLAKGISPQTCNEKGVPLLVCAAAKGDLDIVKLFIQYGAYVEVRSQKQLTPLLMAAKNYRMPYGTTHHQWLFEATIRYLVTQGARLNTQCMWGRTALHFLLKQEWNLVSLIYFLLEHGADPTLVDLYGRRPVDYPVVSREAFSNFHCLYAFTMNTDAEPFIQSWRYENSDYYIDFKPEVWTTQKIHVWEAVVNKLKSQKVIGESEGVSLGLASDCATQTLFVGRGAQTADVSVPECQDYALSEIRCDPEKECIQIKIFPSHIKNVHVHNTIRKALMSLKLHPTILEEEALVLNKSISICTMGLFGLPLTISPPHFNAFKMK